MSMIGTVLMAITALASPALSSSMPRQGPPSGWVPMGSADPMAPLAFTFMMKHNNLANLEKLFWEVSDPTHPNYAQYLSVEDIATIIQPPEIAMDTVLDWLQRTKHHVTKVDVATVSKDYLRAHMTVEAANELFETKFCRYENSKASAIVRICPGATYHLPSSVRASVDYISGLTHLHQPRAALKRVGDRNVSSDGLNDPTNVKKLYNVPPTLKPTAANNSVAVAGFLGQYFSPDDVSAFITKYDPTLPGSGKIAKVVGPNTPTSPGDEASLDTQYIVAMSNGVTSWFWSDDAPNPINNQEPWLDFLAEVANTTQVPWVFSISYGEGESTWPVDYLNRINVEFMKLGLRGVSVLISSGDNGAGCNKGKFDPNFPASSPYVTAVGGTEGVSITPEKVWPEGSGGFSNTFARPTYQVAAVQQYLETAKSSLPDSALWNQTGRAFPDVSAPADNVPICLGGFCGLPVAGTSCAAPIFSGIISLINDVRLQNGKKPLGFLNPILYANAGALNDVSSGSNPGGGCDFKGFPSAIGWDAASGLGTPNYAKLVQLP